MNSASPFEGVGSKKINPSQTSQGWLIPSGAEILRPSRAEIRSGGPLSDILPRVAAVFYPEPAIAQANFTIPLDYPVAAQKSAEFLMNLGIKL